MSIVAERVTIDPLTEDATLVPLDLVGTDPGWGIYLLDHEYPPPELTTQTAGSADTDGDPVVQSKYGNRTINVRVRLFEPSDPASTNIVTNPALKVSAAKWAVSAGTAPVREITSTPPTGLGVDTCIFAPIEGAGRYLFQEVPVVNGKTYRYSVYVRLTSLTATGVKTIVRNAAGEGKGAGATTVSVLNQWVRIDQTFTADSTATWRMSIEQVGAGAVGLQATAMLVEETANLTSYFDGDWPGCDWTGTRGESTSTRPAPDGTRFSRIYRDLTRKLDRIKRRKSGTLRRTAPGFKTGVYDLRTAKITDAPQGIDIGMKRAEIALSFEADPGCRTAEVQIGGTREELTLPCLSFLAEEVPGELEALGRMEVIEKQAVAQGAVLWGYQFETYSSSADAELFYQAESRTPLSGAATAERAGASGAGANTILHSALVDAYQAVMSTQKSGGGNHLAHYGSYRVWARVQRPEANTGQVSLKFVWTDGDFVNTTENDEVVYPVGDHEGVWQMVDLGLVDIAKAPSGSTQRWEGRLLAKSTAANDDIYIDAIFLQPTERSGKAVASSEPAPATTISLLDRYKQTAGALTGKSAEIGGVYAGAGDAGDFALDTVNAKAQRTEVSDAPGVGRYAFLGTVFTDVAAKLRVGLGAELSSTAAVGFVTRYVDVNNYLVLLVRWEKANGWILELAQKVGGVTPTLASVRFTPPNIGAIDLQLLALSNGDWRIGVEGEWLKSGNSAALAAAGALKEGKVGLWDEKISAVAETRTFDNLEVWVPSVDRAMYASRNLELRDDRVRRQDSAGVTWGKPPYAGDYLRIPPAGPEKAVSRFLVKGSRDLEADGGIDDIAAKLFATPRYLIQPPA